MQRNVTKVFQQKADHYHQLTTRVARQFNYWSTVRAVFFVLALVGLVYLANARYASAFWALLAFFVIVFPILIRYHQRLRRKKEHFAHLEAINQDEIKRLHYDLHGFASGEAFTQTSHPYTGDLDIFGEHSLFQLLNRSHTQRGQALLAHWLQHPADPAEIAQRQEAVQELTQDTDGRQQFQAWGRPVHQQGENIHVLLDWVNEPAALPQKGLYTALCYGMALLTVTVIVLYFTIGISAYFPLITLAINGVILWKTSEVAESVHQKTEKSVKALRAYQHMFGHVEQQSFSSQRLQLLQSHLSHQGVSASREIEQLQYILDNFDARHNLFYHIFNIVLLTDIFWLLRADRWKQQLQGDVAQWFESISEIEALASMASFAFAHPGYTFPIIATQAYTLQAEELGHCLIPPEQRVSNDFAMQGQGAITIITGSNMSGKSTFLRTVGINVVLALMGAPVCARRLEVSVMQVFTSMRTQDSLEENVSSFYAELKRLKQLLDALRSPQIPVLFMLDEILKGTNSQDRHHGAASLIRQLSKLQATGFVSTHDLELGQLADELPNVTNYSFVSTIEQDEILFDYKLHDGICQSFNASKLMEKMGIAV